MNEQPDLVRAHFRELLVEHNELAASNNALWRDHFSNRQSVGECHLAVSDMALLSSVHDLQVLAGDYTACKQL